MIARHFRNLLKVKSLLTKQNVVAATAAGASGIHPFVFQKMLGQAKRFTFEELKQRYLALLEAEKLSKTGQRDIDDSLYQFAAAI